MSGIDFVCASPEGYELPAEDIARASALSGGGSVRQLTNPLEAVSDAAAVYTDVWASMGFESELESRMEAFCSYQLNAKLMDAAPDGALIMHDLPAHRDQEITDEMIESPHSVVFDQSENRMHAQQAVLSLVLGGSSV